MPTTVVIGVAIAATIRDTTKFDVSQYFRYRADCATFRGCPMSTPPRHSIRTPDQRLWVFVSSTIAEFAPERAAVKQAIQDLRLAPVLIDPGACGCRAR